MKKRIVLLISCALLIVINSYAQETFSGTVVGPDGSGLPGVSVVERANTNNGVYTDIDGKWTLTVANGDTMLEFSSIGLKTVVIPAKNSTYLKMETDAQLLDAVEVVATGYGLVDKAGYTGAAAVVKNDDLVRTSKSLETALQGKIAGVQVMNGEIRVRGYGSLNADSSPLYVVDGVIGAPRPNSEDVATITVLKDAAATALYGSQGANGVIVMTLKKGREGKPKFNFKYSRDIQQRNNPKWKRLNATQYYQYFFNLARDKFYEAYYKDNETGFNQDFQRVLLSGNNPFNIDIPTNLDGTLKKEAKLLYDTNWEDEVYKKTAQTDRVYFSIVGGTAQTNYNIATSYENFGSFNKGEFDSKRLTNDINFSTKFNKRIRFDLRTNIVYSEESSGTLAGPYAYAPISPIYKMKKVDNGDGTFRYEKVSPEEYNWSNHPNKNLRDDNAVGQIDLNTDSDDSYGLYMYIAPKVTVDFTKNLSVSTLLTGSYNNSQYDSFSNPKHGDSAARVLNGISQKSTSTSRSYMWQNLLNYHRTFADNHKFDLVLGSEFNNNISKYSRAEKSGYLLGDISDEFVFGNKPGNPTSGTIETSRISYFSRLGYSFAGKYYLSGSYRLDGSSLFGPDKRWGKFWSLGASWRISEEEFFKVDWVNDLKLRASYGITGNAALSPYQFGDYFSLQKNTFYNGQVGLKHANLPNSVLSWERAKNFSVGLDFDLLGHRLGGNIDFYKRGSDGLLYDYPIPSTSGFNSILMNVATMKNTGIELALNGVIVKNDDMQWDSRLTFSYNKNEIEELPEHNKSYMEQVHKVWKEGNSRYQYRLKEWAGVNKENGEAQWYKDEEQPDGTTKKVLTNKYEEATLYENVGESAPKVFWGFSNIFTYKGLDLSIDLVGASGHKIYDLGYKFVMNDGNDGFNTTPAEDALNYWTPENKNADNPKAVLEGNNRSDGHSTRWLVDGDFIKIKNIAIGYNFPVDLMQKTPLSSARLFLSVDNVYSFSDYKSGGDPEVGFEGIGRNNIFRGGRVFRIGFDIKF